MDNGWSDAMDGGGIDEWDGWMFDGDVCVVMDVEAFPLAKNTSTNTHKLITQKNQEMSIFERREHP
jgi:hypothetical protein